MSCQAHAGDWCRAKARRRRSSCHPGRADWKIFPLIDRMRPRLESHLRERPPRVIRSPTRQGGKSDENDDDRTGEGGRSRRRGPSRRGHRHRDLPGERSGDAPLRARRQRAGLRRGFRPHHDRRRRPLDRPHPGPGSGAGMDPRDARACGPSVGRALPEVAARWPDLRRRARGGGAGELRRRLRRPRASGIGRGPLRPSVRRWRRIPHRRRAGPRHAHPRSHAGLRQLCGGRGRDRRLRRRHAVRARGRHGALRLPRWRCAGAVPFHPAPAGPARRDAAAPVPRLSGARRGAPPGQHGRAAARPQHPRARGHRCRDLRGVAARARCHAVRAIAAVPGAAGEPAGRAAAGGGGEWRELPPHSANRF